MKSTLIYLDVCVLSRPFDDQQQLRIRLETDAVNLILSQVRQGRYTLGDSQQRPYLHLVPALQRRNVIWVAPAARDAGASRRLGLPRSHAGAWEPDWVISFLEITLVISPAHRREIEAIADLYERAALQAMVERYGSPAIVDLALTRQRAEELVAAGFGVADAAHVAFAEKSGATFISCDDRLLKKCVRHGLDLWCGNPVAYCEKENLR